MNQIGTNTLKKGLEKTLVVSITSGKGGVGKTVSSINMAYVARKQGLSVLILDGDFGLANVDIVLGLRGRYNINDVLDDKVDINEIILQGPMGIDIIPAGSGLANLSNLTYVERIRVLDVLANITKKYDLMIVDTGAGIASNVMHLNGFADEIVIVTNSEPHAMTDAYAMIKVLSQNHPKKRVHVLTNMVRSHEEGEIVWRKLNDVAQRFLGKSIDFLGSIPRDPQLRQAVRMKKVASEHTCHTISGQAWQEVTINLMEKAKPKGNLHQWFKSVLEEKRGAVLV